MSNKTNIPPYNLEHISSYVSGKMSQEEMYAFEKNMLDDPFLSDAVDGYKLANSTKAQIDLANIKIQLLQQKKATKIISFYLTNKRWFSAAAIIILAVGVSTITYLMFNATSVNKQIAIVTPIKKEELIKADTASNINKPIAVNKPNNTEKTYNKQSAIIVNKKATATLSTQQMARSLADGNKKPDSIITVFESKQTANEEIKSTPSAKVTQAFQGRATGAISNKNSIKEIVSLSNAIAANNGILNTKNANANINIRGNSNVAKSEAPLYIVDGLPYDSLPSYANGNTIKSINILKDSAATSIYGAKAANGVVMVTTIKQAEFLAKKEALAKAEKEAAAKNALSEVVVIGYGSAKKKSALTSLEKRTVSPLDSLMPVGGWQYYTQYINQKIGFIGDTTNNNYTLLTDKNGNRLDDIDIEFLVDKEGTAYNVKVVTNIDTTKAKTIANLVQDGPKWITSKKKNKAKITLKNP